MALLEWEALRNAVRDPERKSNMTKVLTDPNLCGQLRLLQEAGSCSNLNLTQTTKRSATT